MIYVVVWPALLASAFALTGSASASANAPRKCGGHPAGTDPIVMVDGVIVEARPDSPIQGIDPEEVYSIEIFCMNPQDSTLNKTHGITVASVWTRQGLVLSARRTLAAIVEAQDSHFRVESRYVDDIDGVTLPPRPSQLLVTVQATARGWIARASVDRLLLTCAVYDGDIPAPSADLLPRQPTCFDDREVRRS